MKYLILLANSDNDTFVNYMASTLQAQLYCQSIIAQPTDFLNTNISQLEITYEIDKNMTEAYLLSRNFVTTFSPDIYESINDLYNIYTLSETIVKSLSTQLSKSQWISILMTTLNYANNYYAKSLALAEKIHSFNYYTLVCSQHFRTNLGTLNTLINGDNAILESLEDQIADIQQQINIATAITATSGLASVGGLFLSIIGGICALFTGGASLTLVAGGVGLMTLGTPTTAITAMGIKELNNKKTQLIQQEQNLREEVRIATGISQALTNMTSMLSSVVTASSQMSNGWELMVADLSAIINNLNAGIISADYVQKLYLTAFSQQVAQALPILRQSRQQLTEITSVTLSSFNDLSDIDYLYFK